MSLGINPRIVNEPRLRAMMARRGIDAILLRGVTMYLITETGVELLTRSCPRDLVVPI